MSIKTTGQNAYFAASNSTNDFVSYYEEVFRAPRINHIWAIKGGPGTGKSHFLGDVAGYATQRGWMSEYIYCSSDPASSLMPKRSPVVMPRASQSLGTTSGAGFERPFSQ